MSQPSSEILYDWPLVIAIEESYVPESAAHVLSTVAELDNEICGLTIKFASWKAQWMMTGN